MKKGWKKDCIWYMVLRRAYRVCTGRRETRLWPRGAGLNTNT
ncbi:MAG: hypothetical protein ACYSRR_01575 [Planctomycetota bacterium]